MDQLVKCIIITAQKTMETNISPDTAFEASGKMQRCQIWGQGCFAQPPLANKWQRYSSHVS
jgi:hypothetical protein